MIQLKRTFTVLILYFFTSSIYADIDNNSTDWGNPIYAKVITLTGGLAHTSPGRNQSRTISRIENIPIIGIDAVGQAIVTGLIPITRTFTNRYQSNNENQVIGTGEAFFALQWELNPLIVNQLGLAIGGAGSAHVQGTIDINSRPSGSSYSYNIYHSKLVARDKIIFKPTWHKLHTFLTGSMGSSFNLSRNYSTSPVIDSNFSAPSFENETNSFSFTYSVGLGIQKEINCNWNFSVGYEFADLGRSNLGSGNFGTNTQALLLGTLFTQSQSGTYEGPGLAHLYTHNLLFSVSYVY